MKRFFRKLPKLENKQKAFSLAEIAIILAVFSTVVVGSLAWVKPSFKEDALKEQITRQRMEVIDKAIKDYVFINNRLPCPANPSYSNAGTVNFGNRTDGIAANNSTIKYHFAVENLLEQSGDVTNNNDCNFAILPSVAASGGLAAANAPMDTQSQAGAVPTKTLNLPTTYMVDGWGRKFRYHVASDLCGAAGYTSGTYNGTGGCNAKTFAAGTGNITIQKQEDLSTITTKAAYVLVSYGNDVVDTFTIKGSRNKKNLSTADYATYSATKEFENKDVDAIYLTKTLPATSFDHIVSYRTKSQLLENTGIGGVISKQDCIDNSSAIATFVVGHFNTSTAASTSMNYNNYWNYNSSTNVNFFNPSKTRAEVVLDIMWTMQDVCYAAYGADRTLPVFDRKCPSGLTYVEGRESPCICPTGAWTIGGC